MIEVIDLFEISNDVILIRENTSSDDLMRWIIGCLDNPGAAGLGYLDAAHYNVVVVYRHAHYGHRRDLQNIIADAIQRLATDQTSFLGEGGAQELLMLVDPIILHSHRVDDVVNSIVSIANTTGRWSTRVRMAALQALLTLPVHFGPAFWLEQFDRLGSEAASPVMEGLARESPQRFIEFAARLSWTPELEDAFICVLGGTLEMHGIMNTARAILPIMPALPEQVVEAAAVLFDEEGVDIFSLMLESSEMCAAVLGTFLTKSQKLPPGAGLVDVVRHAVNRAPASLQNLRALSGAILILLPRFALATPDLSPLRQLLEIATIHPDSDVIAAMVTVVDTMATSNSPESVEASLVVLSTLETTALQLRALTTRAIGTHNHDVTMLITRALSRMVLNERLAEPAIALAAAHLPLEVLERVIHSHLISERTSVAAVVASIKNFHSEPTVNKLLANIWSEAVIEHELELATRIARDYPAIHRSSTHPGLNGEGILAVQDAAAPADLQGLVDGLLDG